MNVFLFALYSILYELIIWGMFGYAVFVLGHSGWWMALAVFLSSAQLKPSYFGIKVKKDKKDVEGSCTY